MVVDMLDSKTVMWKTVTILHDSTNSINQELFQELVIRLQKKMSVIVIDISIRPVDEIFNLKSDLGANFFIIGRHDMATSIYNIVRKFNF